MRDGFQRQEAERKGAEALEEERKRRESCSICQGRGVYYIDNNNLARCDHTGRKKRRSTKGRKQELDTQAVWGQTLKALRDQIPAHIYETRLKDTSFLGMDGNTAFVEVSSYYMVEQLERFYQIIAGILERVLGQKVKPTFPIWLNIPLSKSSAFFKPLSICETLAVGMAIITP